MIVSYAVRSHLGLMHVESYRAAYAICEEGWEIWLIANKQPVTRLSRSFARCVIVGDDELRTVVLDHYELASIAPESAVEGLANILPLLVLDFNASRIEWRQPDGSTTRMFELDDYEEEPT